MKANIFDNIVGVFSPKTKLERLRHKVGIDFLSRNYEAASVGDRTDGWMTTSAGNNSLIIGSTERIRDRARYLTRNNPYAAKIVNVLATNIIGTGIVGDPITKSSQLKEAWKDWCDSTACDYMNVKNFFGIQELVVRETVESGFVFVKRIRATKTTPTKIQTLKAEHLDLTKIGDNIINGIEVDADNKPVAYWLYDNNPKDLAPKIVARMNSKRISTDDIVLVYYQKEAGQLLDVSWLAPVILTLRELDQYMDAAVVAKKISASMVGFVTDPEGIITDSSPITKPFTMTPGGVGVLGPGQDFKFSTPPSNSDFPSFVATELRGCASGMGITYESLSGDLSNVNFSSGRMGWIDMNRNIESWRWNMAIPLFCDRVWGWFYSDYVLTHSDVQKEPTKIQWTAPRRQMINPSEEIRSAGMAIRSGLMSYQEAVKELGYDPKFLLEEIAQHNKDLDAAKIVLDTDPRNVTQGGIYQSQRGDNNQ